jgi:Tol biopolymer transport system component
MDAVHGEEKYLRRLTDGPWTDTMPSWSHDNQWIAFASDRDYPGNSDFIASILC